MLLFIQSCQDVKHQLFTGWSLLHYTVDLNFINITKTILEHGANVNISSNFGWTPLHIAAEAGNTTMVTILLKYGACVNSLDDSHVNGQSYVETI